MMMMIIIIMYSSYMKYINRGFAKGIVQASVFQTGFTAQSTSQQMNRTMEACGLDNPPHLTPRLKKEYSYTSTPHGLL